MPTEKWQKNIIQIFILGDTLIAEKFKDVNEANQVLGDAKKRKRYNIRYYFHQIIGFISIKEIKKKLDSDGVKRFKKLFVGGFDEPENENLDVYINTSITLEEAFNGVTKKISLKTITNTNKTLTVKIPRGIQNEGKVRIKGQGKKSAENGQNGDLYIIAQIEPNSMFILDKNNLVKSFEFSPLDLILGGEFKVNSIDNNRYSFKVPKCAQMTERYTIKDAGFIDLNGKRGDLIIQAKVKIPENISKEEEILYSKLKDLQIQS